MFPLQYSWRIWAHYINDTDWSNKSYISIHNCSNIEEIIAFHETLILSEGVIRKYMLFFMKDDILPMWEDEANRNGGCFWFKIPLDNIQTNWKTILYSIVGNTISSNKLFINDISGVVLSPKKHYYIIQIWMKSRDYTSNELSSTIHTIADTMSGNKIIFKTYEV